MRKNIHSVTAQIKSIQVDCDGVKIFTLTDPEGWPLPTFTSGAHLDVYLPSGKVRQYSLCGDPIDNCQYIIAVRDEKGGRGGSNEIHGLKEGMILPVSLPRSHFSLVDTERYVLIAGGIGITPFLSMLPVLNRLNVEWELHVCARDEWSVPCRNILNKYSNSGRIFKHFSLQGNRLSLESIIKGIGAKEHLYCCGPSSMIKEAIQKGVKLGDRLHFELFGYDDTLAEAVYEVVLEKSGRVIPVPMGQTMLGALRIAGVKVPASCEGGICLECKTRYLGGSPIHRDLVMSADDRKDFITPCVSACASEKLVLDL